MSSMLRFVLITSVCLLFGTVFVIWRVQGSDDPVALAASPAPSTHTPVVSSTLAPQEPVDTMPLPPVTSTNAPTIAAATSTPKATLTAAATATTQATQTTPPQPPQPPTKIPSFYFTVDKTTADWADTVTLSWTVPNSDSPLSLRMQGFLAQGTSSPLGLGDDKYMTWYDLPLSGSITIEMAEQLGNNVCQMENVEWALFADNGATAVNGTLRTAITYDDLPLTLDTVTLAPNPVDAYSSVALAWSGQGGTDFLWTGGAALNEFEDELKYWSSFYRTGASGSHEWVVTRHAPLINYQYKYMNTSSGLPAVCGAVTLNVNCPYTFWRTEPTFDDNSCPLSEALTIPAAYQPFERGVMVWDSELHAIHVLYNDGTNTVFFRNDWAEQEITYPQSPPDGMLLPQRGFGMLWTGSEDVREGLGWAIAEEQPFTTTRQWVKTGFSDFYKGFHPYGPIYFTMPDNRIVRAPVADTSQDWEGGYEGTGWSYRN